MEQPTMKDPHVIILTPQELLAIAIERVLKSKFPKYTVDYAKQWDRSVSELGGESLRVLVLDTAQGYFNPRLVQDLRRRRPTAAVLALHTLDFGRHQDVLYDDIIYPTMGASDIEDVFKLYLGKNDRTTMPTLSKRELEVLRLLVLGKKAKEIAEELFISVHTVTSHRKNLTSKLGIKGLSGLAVYAVSLNLVDPREIRESADM